MRKPVNKWIYIRLCLTLVLLNGFLWRGVHSVLNNLETKI